MAATKTGWRRRWLPPLLVVAGLVVLVGGIILALTAATSVQRFLGWLIATSGALNTVVAGWQLWWVRSGQGGPPPRH
jgi:uncharacterized RDD family membrane protein YckC